MATAIAYGINTPMPVFSARHGLVGYVVPRFGFLTIPEAIATGQIPIEKQQGPPAWTDFPPVSPTDIG